MLKFLRKFQMWILVIGGTLLMIAFLVPQAIQNLGSDASSRKAFTIDGGKVTFGQVNDAAAKAATIRQDLGGLAANLASLNMGIDDRLDNWLLITESARRAGLVGGRADGQAMAEQLVESELQRELMQLARRDFAEYQKLAGDSAKMAQLRDRAQKSVMQRTQMLIARGSTVTVADAYAEARGVIRMLDAYLSAPRMSEARLIAQSKRALDEAVVSYLVVPVDAAAVAGEAEPAADALAAHFEKYKGVNPGEGEFGIGYKYPNGVRLRWLTVDRAQVASAVIVDPVEVERRLMAQGGDAATLAERRAAVQAALREELTEKAFNAAQAVVKGEILRVTSRLTDVTGGTYKALPADWAQQAPDLAAIGRKAAEAASRIVGGQVAAFAVSTREDRWYSAEDLAGMAPLSAARLRRGTVSVPATEAISQVRELRGTPKAGEEPPVAALQEGVPASDPFVDGEGNAHYLVVSGVRPTAAPASLEEVRAAVVTDVKRLAVFERLKGEMETFLPIAADLGMEQLASSLRGRFPGVGAAKSNVRVSREGGVQPAEAGITSQARADAVMDRAQALDPTVPLGQSTSLQRTLATAAPAKLSVVVAQINEFRPLTVERFRATAAGQSGQLVARSVSEAKDAFLSHERLIRRRNVQGLEKPAAEEKAEGAEKAG